MTAARSVIAATLTTALAATMATALPAPAATASHASHGSAHAAAPVPAGVRTHLVRWSSGDRFRGGERNGLVVRKGSLRIGHPVGVRRFDDPYGHGGAKPYAFGRWRSPWVHNGFAFRQLVPSWSARTPQGTWLQVEARVRAGRTGSWDLLGHWSGQLRGLHDTSQSSQPDDVASIAVDTVKTDAPAKAWQIRFTLYRKKGSGHTPTVASVGAVASTPPPGSVQTSRPGPASGRVIDVPRYSQMIHKGHYPQWGGGGEAWCSPTSMAMVLARWHRGPTKKQYAWVKNSYRNPWVEHAARMVFDHRYDGTGNWPFTAAYAGTRGLDAFVTRLPSLRAAEGYIRAGIPLVLSISFGPGELDGAPISSSDGHLLVLRGFTEAGKPVVNDPAAPGNKTVRRVYQRGQLERAWITESAGTAYVAHPAGVRLPRHP